MSELRECCKGGGVLVPRDSASLRVGKRQGHCGRIRVAIWLSNRGDEGKAAQEDSSRGSLS